MDDLIYRSAVKIRVSDTWVDVIDSIHAVGTVKVRHGRWIQKEDKDWAGGGKTLCSKCKYGYSWKMYFEPERFKFCPNCGARMDGQRREDGDNNDRGTIHTYATARNR